VSKLECQAWVWMTGGTNMNSSMSIVEEPRVRCWLLSLTGGKAEFSVWCLEFREKLCGNCPSLGKDFSESAARKRSLTSSTRFVLSPPCQITTAAAIPHKKLAGIRIAVLHAGRWNLPRGGESNLNIDGFLCPYRFKPHMVPHRKI